MTNQLSFGNNKVAPAKIVVMNDVTNLVLVIMKLPAAKIVVMNDKTSLVYSRTRPMDLYGDFFAGFRKWTAEAALRCVT